MAWRLVKYRTRLRGVMLNKLRGNFAGTFYYTIHYIEINKLHTNILYDRICT